ncbi:molybdopterin-binding protein [Mesobacterium pallidum]|uniref:molybdopterin-binding protein n=1 Tax=Mesobacterium pallidum TaxID=2872037 RepID=UPI001EE1EE55|nr:molybdopterin-binding protein [Mesobacterium pallidum]
MKFGPVPVTLAEGAILAHSVKIEGRKLKKGLWLGPEEIARLTEAGIDEVIVARLDADDCHEDTAAARIAKALVPDEGAAGLTRQAPFTGRVNLLAQGPGVVRLDADRLAQLNAINPLITLATVPDYQQLGPRGMAATIKIISYGVPEADVVRASEIGRDAIRLERPVYQTATLIITEIPGGPGRKGEDAIAARIEALGLTLAHVECVPHHTAPLAEALARVSTDMALILTGSATSDPGDVAPEAVRQAGGRVERFGMPVDPGNLLFLGCLGQRPVIGLPGCARSPALNGADWVLARVACGIEVTGADIAAMGVGGLLKEIPTRPQPRRGKAKR